MRCVQLESQLVAVEPEHRREVLDEEIHLEQVQAARSLPGEIVRKRLHQRVGSLLAKASVDEPLDVVGVAHVAGLDEDLRHIGEVQPSEVAAFREPVATPDIGRVRHSGPGRVARMNVESEAIGIGGDVVRVAGDARRIDDVESTAIRGAAVSVNRDAYVCVRSVADCGAFVDARSPAVVVSARQHDVCPFWRSRSARRNATSRLYADSV